MGVNLYIVLPSAFIALFSSFPWCCWFHAALDQLMEIHSTIPFYFFFFCGRRWRYLLFLHKDLLLSSNFVVAAGQLKRCSCLWYPHSAAVFLYIALSLQRSHGSYGQMARSYGSFSQYTFSVWIFFSSGFLFVVFFLQLHNTPVFYTNIYLSSQFRALQWRLFLTHECQIKIFKRKFFSIFYKPLCCGTYTTSGEGTSRLHDRKRNVKMAGLAVHPIDSLPRRASLRDSYLSIRRAWISASYSRSLTGILCSADQTLMNFENSESVSHPFFTLS